MLQNNGGEYYCLSLPLSSAEVGPSPLPGESKVYMPWYALKGGDDGGTWGIGGMTTCEVGMGIIMPLLRMTMLLNKSTSWSSRSSSLQPCSASLSALLSTSCISVVFISSRSLLYVLVLSSCVTYVVALLLCIKFMPFTVLCGVSMFNVKLHGSEI